MSAVGEMTVNLADLRLKVLARFAEELHEAGPEQLVHLAERAEAPTVTDLGPRMRELVDEERARRVFTVALMPLPPLDGQPQAGPRPSTALPERVPAVYAAVAKAFGGDEPDFPRGALGFDFWAVRKERWEAAGRVGDPSDPEYDDAFYQGRDGGEGSF